MILFSWKSWLSKIDGPLYIAHYTLVNGKKKFQIEFFCPIFQGWVPIDYYLIDNISRTEIDTIKSFKSLLTYLQRQTSYWEIIHSDFPYPKQTEEEI